MFFPILNIKCPFAIGKGWVFCQIKDFHRCGKNTDLEKSLPENGNCVMGDDLLAGNGLRPFGAGD